MKKHYLKKLIFLFSISLLSISFLGCTREIPMPIIGDIEKNNLDKNSENKTNVETITKNSGIETSKEENNNSDGIKETSSVKSESITVESITPRQTNNEEHSDDNSNSENLNTITSTANENDNTIFNIRIHNNNDKLTEKKIGYIYNIAYSNNTYYLEFDDVEFFSGEEANKESLADGNSEESQATIESGYYIRNSNNGLKKYTLTEDCTYELCKYQVDSSNNDIHLVSVDFETLKNYILKYQEFYPTRALLFDINTENNIITKVSMHFTP